ncbi:hypothetical protein COL47_05980 [Bacillus toyonensis]|uniref:Abortive phage infection protein C-terminal domain-containing protein n=1 Tax=Bacillus wiedmannii TaxID=1890302 RepID=A0AB73RSW3_9BACI|nr:hypothetical protein CN694_04230 [Bacillus wiedmannii]PFY22717.1 hypothetical protein COL47_05980 [Bacillus toyonensis]
MITISNFKWRRIKLTTKPKEIDPTLYPCISNFNSRKDLEKYNSEAWALFALDLHFNIEDIHVTASHCITDGKNDRKCDIIYINEEEQKAIIAQSYTAEKIKISAKKNKASDLNTAISWLLSRELDELPTLLKARAEELRDFILSEKIKKIEVWYIHNCLEHPEISNELKTVEHTGQALLQGDLYKNLEIDLKAKEIGLSTIESWYKSSKATILINEAFEVETLGGYVINNTNWRVYNTAVSASWIQELFKKYNDDLFSANIRGYLGSRKDKNNINNNIKNTMEEQPENFFIFNNGITALVNQLHLPEEGTPNKLKIEGISIVNGAQTTGSIGSLKTSLQDSKSSIPLRFIECGEPEVIQNIIRYNNSQNNVQVSDFRSTDVIQTRLRSEFATHYPDLTYLGGRRGSAEDTIKRIKNLISSDQVAQSLKAFHGDVTNATHYKSKIWEDDNLYSEIFNEHNNAKHIIFIYSLNQALISYKQYLKDLSKSDEELKDLDAQTLAFFSKIGWNFMIINTIGQSLDILLDKKITSKFDLQFDDGVNLEQSIQHWKNLMTLLIPNAIYSLSPALEDKVRKSESIKTSIENFKIQLNIARQIPFQKEIFNSFADSVKESKK